MASEMSYPVPGTLHAVTGSQSKPDRSRIGRFNLTFNKLVYKVRTYKVNGVSLRCKRDWKYILKEVSGEFLSGELTGIIGPSGCGKSTLMDVLSGYTTLSQYEGTVLYNGEKTCLRKYNGCYIMQDNQLQPLLTVLESMNFAANLKLSCDISYKERKHMINSTLKTLSLIKCENTLTMDLSPGQKKRLAIALELLSDPPVMFFDEPTSGLDSSVAKNVLEILRSSAKEGRIVICSIHQPSALLLDMLDHLYSMARGQCIYQGSPQNLIPYLSSLNCTCPPYHNPADFIIELTFGEDVSFAENIANFVRASGNGLCHNWRGNHFASKTSSHNISSMCSSSENKDECETSDNLLSISYSSNYNKRKACSTSFFNQSVILFQRTVIRLYREKFLIRTSYLLHILVGFLIGSIFRGIGNDAAHVFDNFSFLFFCLMFIMFTAFSAMVMAFPLEIPVITREYFNSWYSLKSYYFSLLLNYIIFQILCTTTYCTIVYLCSWQPRDIGRFTMFTFVYILVSLVSQQIGLLVGASMKLKHGMVFGALFIAPWVIFSGFFLHLSDASPLFHWIFHLSFLKHGLEAVMHAIYGYNRTRLPCSKDYCHYISPKKLLKEFDMLHNDYWTNCYILLSYFIVLYVATYYMLKYKVSHKR